MRVFVPVVLLAAFVACNPSSSTAPREKTSAEKAEEAGVRARKKAEEIKKEQDRKNKEAVETTQP